MKAYRYTHFTLEFMNKEVKALNSSATLQDYLDSCPHHKCMSTVGMLALVYVIIHWYSGVRQDTYPKDPKRVRVTDFFGSARMVRQITEDIVLDGEWAEYSPSSSF